MPFCTSCGRPLTGEGRFCAACGTPQAAALPADQHPAQHPAPLPTGPAPPPAPGARRPFPGWAVALFVVIALCAITGFAAVFLPLLILGGIASTFESIGPTPGAVSAAQVRTGVRAIQVGIETWRADNSGGVYPPEAVVTPARFDAYVDPWPVNPYAGGLMQPGEGPGGYVYVRLPGGEGYTLTGYGGDGAPVTTAGGANASASPAP